jgi:hypothetical protein
MLLFFKLVKAYKHIIMYWFVFKNFKIVKLRINASSQSETEGKGIM